MTRGFATISPECETVFDEVKETDNLDYVIYEASAHDKKISVATSGKYNDYSEVLAHFKDDTPRYAVVDFKYDSPDGDGQRHKLVFITWVPEAASIHDKSYYTTNKDHLFRALLDISIHVQAHTQAELAHAASMYREIGKQAGIYMGIQAKILLLSSLEAVQGTLSTQFYLRRQSSRVANFEPFIHFTRRSILPMQAHI